MKKLVAHDVRYIFDKMDLYLDFELPNPETFEFREYRKVKPFKPASAMMEDPSVIPRHQVCEYEIFHKRKFVGIDGKSFYVWEKVY